MAEPPHTTFMTGATGFLGNFLLRDLLDRDRRMVILLRDPVEARLRGLSHAMRALGVDVMGAVATGRVVPVAGALPDALPARLDVPVDDILSCAASLQLFANGNDEPHRTNVTGTLRLIDWAREHRVSHIHAVSTAYVCGSHTRRVREVLHEPAPGFKTDYERSKWLAESHLASWGQRRGCRLTLYRPSFLVGDSRTGYTTQYGGFYQFARMVSMLKQRFGDGDRSTPTYVPLRIPGRPEDPQNFVPVDFASRIITEVMADPSLHGRIYHLTDPRPPSNDRIKRLLEEYFNLHGGTFADREEVVDHCTPAESLLWEQYDVATPRVTHNPRFEADNTAAVMRSRDLRFPSMDRDLFATLLDFAVTHHWGQRSNGSARHTRRTGGAPAP